MKSKPQGLVLKKFFKTLRQKKVILAIALVFSIAAVALFLFPQKENSAKLVLTAEGAKFKANFIFPSKTRNDFEQVLSSVNAPVALLDGVEFELESTASSALAFALPVAADLKIDKKEISFSGSHTYPNIAKIDPEKFKFPQSTNLAVFTQSAKAFLKNSQSLPFEFSGWLDENLNSKNGYYIGVFNQDSAVLVIFQPEKIDFGRLSNLEFKEAEAPSYKKEKLANDTDVHFVKLDDEKNLSAAIFEKDGWVYLIFSESPLQETIDFYLSENGGSVEFPESSGKPASFIGWFRNTGNFTSSRYLYRLLLGQNLESAEAFKKIEEARFSLLGNSFSGLIKFK